MMLISERTVLLLLLALQDSSSVHVVVDDSVTHYVAFRYCMLDEPCKASYDDAFNCKCLPQYVCSARSFTREAFCSITVGLGYVWLQPPLQEGKFILDIPEETK